MENETQLPPAGGGRRAVAVKEVYMSGECITSFPYGELEFFPTHLFSFLNKASYALYSSLMTLKLLSREIDKYDRIFEKRSRA